MLLNCSACSSRYLVDPHVFRQGGRKVRCAKCAHVWFQEPPFDAPESGASPSLEPRAIPKGSNLPSVQNASTGGRNFLGWATLLLFIAGGLAIGFLARQQAITAWPPIERLYSAVGLAPEIVGAGLEIRSVTSGRMLEGDSQWLVIKGEILNASRQVLDVPRLSGTLQNSAGQTVHGWFFVANEMRLLPGEIVVFETRVKDPAPTADSVVVGFSRRD